MAKRPPRQNLAITFSREEIEHSDAWLAEKVRKAFSDSDSHGSMTPKRRSAMARIKEQTGLRVTIDGVTYPSRAEAMRKTGMSFDRMKKLYPLTARDEIVGAAQTLGMRYGLDFDDSTSDETLKELIAVVEAIEPYRRKTFLAKCRNGEIE